MERAQKYFATVLPTFEYDDWKGPRDWPQPQNWAWQSLVRHVEAKVRRPFFWWETDAVLLRKGALDRIDVRYDACKKPFMGFVWPKTRQMNGTACYPANVTHFTKRAMLTQKAAWDVVLSLDCPNAIHVCNDLFHHEWKPPEIKTHKWLFQVLQRGTVIYHQFKSGNLFKLLRAPEITHLVNPSKTPKIDPGYSTNTFYHSGDLGDIIYSLPTIAAMGGGRLILGPEVRIHGKADPAQMRTRVPMTLELFDWFAPLLRSQPYISSVVYAPSYPNDVDIDLNRFREIWFDAEFRKKHSVGSLYQAYASFFGLQPLILDKPWMLIDKHITAPYPVIIHRSARYRNPSFPWEFIASHYKGKMGFIGLESEHRDWMRDFGSCPYVPCANALEMAQYISACNLFIGNQSLPNAIAISLMQWVIQETYLISPDCAPPMYTLQCVRDGRAVFPTLPKRLVVPTRDANGIYHLGPHDNAFGLGDLLTLTPLAKCLGSRAVIHLPPHLSDYAPLFYGLCSVDISDEFPVIDCKPDGHHRAKRTLNWFDQNGSHLPVIKLTGQEIAAARKRLASKRPGIVFVPTTSRHWAHVRMRPPEFWEPIVSRLSKQFDLYQYGYDDYPLVTPAIRHPRGSIREQAATYAVLGRYLGVDTGDLHLMLAVGGICAVLTPDLNDAAKYSHSEWQYDTPRCLYQTWDTPEPIYDFLTR